MQPGHQDPVLKFEYRGAPQTVGVMVRYALEAQRDPTVRRLAEYICAGLPSKAYLDEYLAIYRFVLDRVRYMRDPRTVELVRAPWVLAREILSGQTPSADCDDMATLICALDLAVGGKCDICTVAFKDAFYRGQRQYSHVFARAYEPQSKTWIIQDPVAGSRTAAMRRKIKSLRAWPVA